MQAPKIEKITVNMGVGDAKQDSKMLEAAAASSSRRSPARSPTCAARASRSPTSSCATAMPVGLAVTLRGERAYEFLDRLTSVAIPRIRDFRGLPAKLDGRGNYTIGVREQIIFPEIDYDAVDQVRGLDITITTTAKTDEEGCALLEMFGMPFVRSDRGELSHRWPRRHCASSSPASPSTRPAATRAAAAAAARARSTASSASAASACASSRTSATSPA